MIIEYLGNGSNGNSTYVFDGTTSILIDNGLALKRIPYEVNGGILLSHGHSDHISGIEKYLKKYRKSGIRCICDRSFCLSEFGKLPEELLHYEDFTTIFYVGTLEIEPFGIWHDEPCFGFLINKKYVHITDTGSIPFTVAERLKRYSTIEVIYMECNYDEELIETAEYEEILKLRIKSRLGHLSNQHVINFLNKNQELLGGVKHIILGHLSGNTNNPETLNKRIDELLNKEIKEKVMIGVGGTRITI